MIEALEKVLDRLSVVNATLASMYIAPGGIGDEDKPALKKKLAAERESLLQKMIDSI